MIAVELATGLLIYGISMLVITRVIYGLVNGLTLPISYVVISEIIPKANRGKGNVFPVFSELVGRLYILFIGYFYIEPNMIHGNWRALALYNIIPATVALTGTVAVLIESPRYLLSLGRPKEAIRTINYMG